MVRFVASIWSSTKVVWSVHRLTTMQWLKLTKCVLFFNIVSSAVHTLLPLALQHLDSHGTEVCFLTLKKMSSIRYYFIITPIPLHSQVFLSCCGTENSQMVPNQENVESDQPVMWLWQDAWTLDHLQDSLYSFWIQLPTFIPLIKLEHHPFM